MEKTMKARVQHKHDVEANWLKATNFTPLASEIIVYDSDENYNYPRIKIGDGETNINDLPFIVDEAKITEIISSSLEDAKNSGEFDGKDGQDGTSATHSWNGTVLTVTSASGTSSADLKGVKGDKGEKGDTGAQGIQGEPGEKGEKGDKGDKGDTGAQGESGKDGTSATHSWNGTVLTISSASGTSSADLKGAKGDKGDKGNKGDTGDQGIQGIQGPKGDTGAPGMAWKGIYNNTTNYSAGDVVYLDGTSYIATVDIIQDGQAFHPEKDDAWEIVAQQGANGASGASVTVKSVSESSTDGGSNVVTFSDGKTLTVKNGAKGSTGATGSQGPKGDTGSTGATGQRGTGQLSVTTAPSSYTTAVGGITPKYRMAISTIKTQAGVTEVLLGDIIRYSYYQYPIAYLDSSYAYCTTRVSLRGTAGTSVTVSSVTESAEDGGSNVITFSDETTLTVKNGKTGAKGDSYNLTVNDKSEIASRVIEMLGGNPVFGYVEEETKAVVLKNAPGGEYTYYYIMDGTRVEIGQPVEDTYFTITNNLTNCTSNNSATQVIGGQSYSATITAKSGYEMSSIKVAMGGTDISSSAVSGGKITISNVTGNIVITAVATEVATAPKGNLADPTSADWMTDKRLAGGYGYAKDCTGFILTNYIPVKAGDVLRVKGLNLYGISGTTQSSVGIYTSKDTSADSTGRLNAYESYRCTSIKASASSEGAKEKVAKNGDIFTYTILLHGDGTQRATAETAYTRISAPLMDGYTANDVIITVNEEIAAGEPVNLAQTDSTNKTDISIWCNDARLGSDFGYRALAGNIVTNYFSFEVGDIVYVKGLTIDTTTSSMINSLSFYDSSKNGLSIGNAEYYLGENDYIDLSSDANYPYIFDTTKLGNHAKVTGTKFMRIAATLTGSLSDVVINVKRNGVWVTTNESDDSDSGSGDTGSNTGYTNVLPLAVDKSGNKYVGNPGGAGYRTGYKLSLSTDTESLAQGACVSGYIELKGGTKIRIKNISLHSGNSINNLGFYDETKTLKGKFAGTAGAFTSTVKVTDGVYLINLSSWYTTDEFPAFLRFSCGGITDETIVTIDEEITD